MSLLAGKLAWSRSARRERRARRGGERAKRASSQERRASAGRVPRPAASATNRQGQASVLLIGALVMGLAFAGLGIDGARLFTARRDLHNVADSAALAGASAIDEPAYRESAGSDTRLDPAGARAAVQQVLDASNLPRGTVVDVKVDSTRVEVRLSRPVRMTFLRIIGLGEEAIGASAAASPRTK